MEWTSLNFATVRCGLDGRLWVKIVERASLLSWVP